jgi:arginine exporter protein ArgO
MNSEEREKLAKQRFMILTYARFMDLALVIAGVANLGGKLLPELSPYLGYTLLLAGAFGFFWIPIILKKTWVKQDAEKG